MTNSLEASGLTEQSARIAKGIYDRGQPLVQLGLVVAMALSSTFLPTLTKYLTVKNQHLFEKSAKMYLRLTLGIASASAVGLAILLPYINFALLKMVPATVRWSYLFCGRFDGCNPSVSKHPTKPEPIPCRDLCSRMRPFA